MPMNTIFDERDQAALLRYLGLVRSVKPDADILAMERQALAAVRYYKGDAAARAELVAMQELEQRWYASLAGGKPDYGVYDDEWYVADVWACWVVYSRKTLFTLAKWLKADATRIQDVKSVADLGCGSGYTTSALQEIFPAALTYGTQLPGTLQYRVCVRLSPERGFFVRSLPDEQADLVFASEYFEHFEEPVKHLDEVLDGTAARYLVIANSFGARSIGHFPVYLVKGTRVSNTEVGRAFNDHLRARGYERVETGFWNNRPSVWRKQA